MAPKISGEKQLAETEQEVDQIIFLMEIISDSKVLDLRC
jgi:hypothetical protein